jgi:hypothetical protein
MAASASLDQADKFLTDRTWEWSIGEAYQAIEQAMIGSVDADAFTQWSEARRVHRRDLQRFAHTHGALLLQAVRYTGTAFAAPRGPHADRAMLRRTAPYHVILAEGMVFAIGWALRAELAEDGSWTQLQRAFLDQYGAYTARLKLSVNADDDTTASEASSPPAPT